MKPKWLDRALLTGPYLTLVTSEDEYRTVLKRLKCEYDHEWLNKGEGWATTHILSNADHDLTCVVCVVPGEHSDSAMAAMMAHEAVHVWRAHLDNIGEDEPGEEIEAYAIQRITLALTDELFQRRDNVTHTDTSASSTDAHTRTPNE